MIITNKIGNKIETAVKAVLIQGKETEPLILMCSNLCNDKKLDLNAAHIWKALILELGNIKKDISQ